MNTEKLFNYLNSTFPIKYQESFDNSGEQVYFPENKVENILISLDINSQVIEEAIKNSCNVIITHHPLFFRPVKNIVQGNPQSDIIIKLVDNKISLISLHTNLDKIYFNKLAEFLGFAEGELLIRESNSEKYNGDKEIGFGLLCKISHGILLDDLIKRIKDYMKLEHIVYSGCLDKKLHSIAFINGSGSSFFKTIIDNKMADCIVTGDVGYHNAYESERAGVSVIDAGHYNTEVILLNFLINNIQDYLTNCNLLKDIHIYLSSSQENPLKIY